jgi:hypothetical protein
MIIEYYSPLFFLFLYYVGVLNGGALDGVPCYLKAAYRLIVYWVNSLLSF